MRILRLLAVGVLVTGPAWAQTTATDKIGELIRNGDPAAEVTPADPREGDPSYEQARALMRAIDGILNDVAEQRAEAKKLPAKDEFLVTPLWTETREDREDRIRKLLDATLGMSPTLPSSRCRSASAASPNIQPRGEHRHPRKADHAKGCHAARRLHHTVDSLPPRLLITSSASPTRGCHHGGQG